MADPRGFMTTGREGAKPRPVSERVQDWNEIYPKPGIGKTLLPIITEQAGRCMDCGIPFCHDGCPLGNLIPEWNDLVWRDDWHEASERLHATNNFPEFTGRLCPAPCEAACVVAISDDPVTIKNVEVAIIDRAFEEGWVAPQPPERLTDHTVAVIGSGPAGLAAAQQLTRAGHTVAVYERDDSVGGLLRYGIPEFKMEKRHIERRLDQMRAEGTIFRTGIEVGETLTGQELKRRYDAVVLAVGATQARDLPIPGRELDGIHQAMEYLPQANRTALGEHVPDQITAEGKHVVIIGGGDTGADCLGTAHRQGAASVTQLEIMPEPPEQRPESTPWPTWPLILRTSSAHEEGGERLFSVSTQEFLGDDDGRVRALKLVEVQRTASGFEPVEGSERELPADLVLLSMGFTGPEQSPLLDQLAVDRDERTNIVRDRTYETNVPGVFVAGDAGRGQSLIVWAIAEGRACAAEVDRWLTGAKRLPAPVEPADRPLTV
ncbi:glutamate synthase subunit beta [Actinobacteria bacterium YIM 96077]|uniref:Glutamate synthase n=1 Tax=Phytoactinopolyspora halophila TaxID=1981511 RepID=A0A329QWG3_9ACTN|nr:glutamate synthase subunit beta [Phytoactinopolyspora halophila]AYY12880.1 glutamate synthase subunit beta [Actinobacteria bacterium YIM 96077]RAW16326.1 glutamate synthase [Phytoactinopolyspora halophila]